MRKGIIIQARTGSQRLPNKLLLDFSESKGILEILLQNILSLDLKIPIIIATTNEPNDYEIVEIAKKFKVLWFKGDTEDVLERFISTATKYELDYVIRICADNPFLDISSLVEFNYFNDDEFDYLYYSKKNLTPTIVTHYGFWPEMISLNSLKKIREITNIKYYHEHITSYIIDNINDFKTKSFEISKFIDNQNSIRLTVDTEEDFDLVKEIYKKSNHKNNPVLLVNEIINNKSWCEQMTQQIIKNKK
jgi:spore coat polysaccharide biosynthesis protein SpsF